MKNRYKNLKNEPSELVTISELARRTGMTEAMIRSRISSGAFVDGTHFYRKGRRIMLDPEACKDYWLK